MELYPIFLYGRREIGFGRVTNIKPVPLGLMKFITFYQQMLTTTALVFTNFVAKYSVK